MTGESVDDVLGQLRAMVAERKAAGAYPPGLEDSLDRHFDQIAVHQAARYDYDALRRRIVSLDVAGSFSVDDITFDTRLPGGSQLHRAVAKIVSRQTAGILAQVQRYADAVQEVLWEVLGALETPAAHTHADLDDHLAAAVEGLARAQRAGEVPSALAGLEARVAALEAADHGSWPVPDARPERHPRPPAEARAHGAALAERFRGCEGRVVDLGCGDGWFLRLLAERGIDAVGVEGDGEAVGAAREEGLDVEQGEVLPWLRDVADGTLGGIALLHLVDRLPPQEVVELVALAHRKVRKGGRLVVDTLPSERGSTAAARGREGNRTAHAPVHPAYLQFLLREVGFDEVVIEWPATSADGTSPSAGADETAARLTRLLVAAQDYTLVARR